MSNSCKGCQFASRGLRYFCLVEEYNSLCPCSTCLVKVMCSNFCKTRRDFYNEVQETKDKKRR